MTSCWLATPESLDSLSLEKIKVRFDEFDGPLNKAAKAMARKMPNLRQFHLELADFASILVFLGAFPPDESLLSEEQVQLSDLLVVGVPTGDACGCFDAVDEVGRRDGLLRGYAVVPGKVGSLLDDLVLLHGLLHALLGCGCRLDHFLLFGASGSVTQIQANLFSSQKNFFAR